MSSPRANKYHHTKQHNEVRHHDYLHTKVSYYKYCESTGGEREDYSQNDHATTTAFGGVTIVDDFRDADAATKSMFFGISFRL